MRSKAFFWFGLIFQKYINNKANNKEVKLVKSFPYFKAYLRRTFKPANKKANTQSII